MCPPVAICAHIERQALEAANAAGCRKKVGHHEAVIPSGVARAAACREGYTAATRQAAADTLPMCA